MIRPAIIPWRGKKPKVSKANNANEQQPYKWVYLFEEGSGDNKSLFGGKGAGLCEMTQAGLPVPPGLIVTTEVCNAYYSNNKQFPEGMWEQVTSALKEIEKKVGKKFGDAKNPLLVSVRSGAAFSMPGMMDTVLNLGLNEETVTGLAEQTGDLRFALDAYRRFASLFGEIVIGVAHEKFERVMDRFKAQTGGDKLDTDLKPDELRGIIAAEKEIILAEQHSIPDDPYEQLRVAIGAVFNSWMGRRAIDYRRINRIPDDLGTAVNVQAMVFGNMGANSGTGVAFTRDPATGERHAFLWEASTGMQDLGTLETLGGRFSVADAINERGQIVGRALTAGGIHAVLWDPVGCVTPSITSVRATPNLIWPPNHKMVPLSVVADAHAVCGPPVCTILSIASDGPTDRITDDTAITGNLTALVRAERSGASMGRTYTITVECDDTAGNAATGTTLVRVPHDQGK
jgi:probable HAF family extracellular repeat protein